MKEKIKKYYGLAFLIGFGFFTMGIMEPLYETYVPIFLGKYINESTYSNPLTVIGLIMTIDNIMALFMIPLVTNWSDRINTKIGRRMPFIIIMLPLAALFFGFIPFAALYSLASLIIIVGIMNVFKQTAYGPVVALMPDTIPGDRRSEANGVINLMGGAGAIVSSLVIVKLFMKVKIKVPGKGPQEGILPFLIAGALIIIAVFLLFIFIKEKFKADPEKKEPMLQSFKKVLNAKDKSAFFILLGIFFWFLAYEGVKPFLGKFSLDVLNVSKGNESLSIGIFVISYSLLAIPSGIIGHKIGRKKIIKGSLIGCTAVMVILAFYSLIFSGFGLSSGQQAIFIYVMMFIFGIFWAPIVTNSFPMLWQMATFTNIGIYTGLYYTFKQCSSILAPVLSGLSNDLSGKNNYTGMFIFAAACMTLAAISMLKVTKGEPEKKIEV